MSTWTSSYSNFFFSFALHLWNYFFLPQVFVFNIKIIVPSLVYKTKWQFLFIFFIYFSFFHFFIFLLISLFNLLCRKFVFFHFLFLPFYAASFFFNFLSSPFYFSSAVFFFLPLSLFLPFAMPMRVVVVETSCQRWVWWWWWWKPIFNDNCGGGGWNVFPATILCFCFYF